MNNQLICNVVTRNDITQNLIQEAKSVLYASLRAPGTLLAQPKQVKDFLEFELAGEEHEVFACLFLNSQHQLIAVERLFYGTIDGAAIYPREVVKASLKHNAAAVIFSHNHPSGDSTPSEADKRITKTLKDILAVVDVRVLDHIVVGYGATYSFAEEGLL